MIPINKAHPDILEQTSKWSVFISIKNGMNGKEAGQIYFSKAAAVKFDIKVGSKIEFFNDPWRFVVSDSEDGFLVTATGGDPKQYSTTRISNRALVRMILNDLEKRGRKIKRSDHFLLQQTKLEYKGKPIIEILFFKSVQEIGK